MLCTFLHTVNLTKWHKRSQDRKGKREGWFLSLVSVTTVCRKTTEAYLHLCRRPVTTCFGQVVFSCPAILHVVIQSTFFSYPACPVGGGGAVAECVHKLVSCSGINCLVLVLKCCYTEKQRLRWEERLQVVHLLPVVFPSFHNRGVFRCRWRRTYTVPVLNGFFFWMDVTVLDGFCHYCDLCDFSFRTQRFAFTGHQSDL